MIRIVSYSCARFSHSNLLSDLWEDDEAFFLWKPRGEKILDILSWKSDFVFVEGGEGGKRGGVAGLGGGGGGGVVAKPAVLSKAV